MNKTKEIIEHNQIIHKDFLYYLRITQKIEGNLNKNPDISIESCKTLIEGICKTIILNSIPWITSAEKKRIEKQDFVITFKEAMNKLSGITDVEWNFINTFKNMMTQLWRLRNCRGDISHWKATPKEHCSSYDFALLVTNITDNICYYILWLYFNASEEITYENNEEFNNYLDEDNEEIFWQSYSFAMFTLDYDKYESELDLFNANQEENE